MAAFFRSSSSVYLWTLLCWSTLVLVEWITFPLLSGIPLGSSAGPEESHPPSESRWRSLGEWEDVRAVESIRLRCERSPTGEAVSVLPQY